MKSHSPKRVILLLAIAISVCTLALIGAQFLWMKTLAENEQENFTRSMQQALQSVINEIDLREISLLREKRIAPRLFQSNRQRTEGLAAIRQFLADTLSIHSRISMAQLDTMLYRALREVQIFSPYEFAVTADDASIVFETAGFNRAQEMQGAEKCYNITLFPFEPEEFPKYYLSVYTFYETAYALRAMRWMIAVSVAMTLIITATFATTLIIIFRQKRLSKIKNDFIGNITHELKTPIATISLASQMLQDPDAPHDREQLLRLSGMIKEENQRLLELVESVLRSAIGDHERIKFSQTDIDLHELLQKVLARFALQFTALQATCTLQLDARHTHIMGDELHIANVLSNLIDNAIKYRRAGVPLAVTVKTENTGKDIVLAITDNGMGLNGHNLRHLFDQFYRKPIEHLHTVKGFGLGLYYSKNIIEAHNGKLSASGNGGNTAGCTFTIALPIYSE